MALRLLTLAFIVVSSPVFAQTQTQDPLRNQSCVECGIAKPPVVSETENELPRVPHVMTPEETLFKQNMLEVQKTKLPVCAIDPAHPPKQVVFAFEGMNGYCPLRTAWSLYHPDLTNVSNADSAREIFPEKTFDRLTRASENEIKHHNCLLSTFLAEHQKTIRGSQSQVLYYKKTDVAAALACLKTLSLSPELKFKVMGFSMGGHAAVQFAQTAQKEVKIERMMTVDPVAKGLGWFSSVFDTAQNNSHFETQKLNNSMPWVNIYQREDSRSLVLAGIRGNEVKGATNFRIMPKDLTYAEGKVGHLAILTTEAVDLRFKEFMNDLEVGSLVPPPVESEAGE
jgi:hypothetical protein